MSFAWLKTRVAVAALALVLVGGGSAAFAAGKTYYVDGSATGCGGKACSDSNTGLTEATAFATPQGCVQNMSGGDTCLIKNGTYSRAGDQGYIPGFNFCRTDGSLNGTASQYTTIKNYPGHKPKICATADCAANPPSPAIGVFEVSAGSPSCGYVSFQGLEVQGAIEARTGWGTAPSTGVHHVEIAYNDLHGGFDCDGNYSMVRLEAANHLYVHHNYIHDMDNGGGCGYNSSAAGIKLFVNSDTRVEYNTIVGNSYMVFGVDDKDDSVRNIHRFNRISNTAAAAFRLNAQTASFGEKPADTEIAGNLILGNGITLMMDIARPYIHHNTIIGGAPSINFYFGSTTSNPVTGAVIRDNVGQTSQGNLEITINSWGSRSGDTIDYNRYDSSSSYRGAMYGSGDATYGDIASWRTAMGSGLEAHSTEAAAPVCAWADTTNYTITSGTACKTLSSSGGEVGVYGLTSCVGHTCGAASTPVCGNGVVETGESCDGTNLNGASCTSQGFGGGTLSCNSSCGFDTSACTPVVKCGNGVIDSGEKCDGANLGGATCSSLGFSGGTLSCNSSCALDTSACTSSTPPSTTDECSSPQAGWILCDGFESGTMNYWKDDLSDDGGRLAAVSGANAYTGGYVGRQTQITGGTGGWGTKYFGDHPLLSSPGGQVSDFYLRSMVRFSAGYSWPTGTNKMFVVAAFESWSASYPQPLSYSPYYVIFDVDSTGRPQLEVHRKVGSDVWRTLAQNIGTPVALTTGAWHELQIHLKLNTPGAADGVAEIWIDGVRKAAFADVDFRSTYTTRGWNHLLLSPYGNPSSPANQTQDWDNIVGSTSFITWAGTNAAPNNVQKLIRVDVH